MLVALPRRCCYCVVHPTMQAVLQAVQDMERRFVKAGSWGKHLRAVARDEVACAMRATRAVHHGLARYAAALEDGDFAQLVR